MASRSDLIVHRLEKQLQLIYDTCLEDVLLYEFDVSDAREKMSSFGRILIDTDVYYSPTQDISVQEHTMQILVDLIEYHERARTLPSSLSGDKRHRLLELGYAQSTIFDLQLLYIHIVLYAYILDCMYHLPFDNTFVYKNDLIFDVSVRWNSLLEFTSQIPPLLVPVYDVLLSRGKLLKDKYDMITSNTFEQSRQRTSLIFEELMSHAWNPTRYFAWCIDTKEQQEICNRWTLISN